MILKCGSGLSLEFRDFQWRVGSQDGYEALHVIVQPVLVQSQLTGDLRSQSLGHIRWLHDGNHIFSHFTGVVSQQQRAAAIEAQLNLHAFPFGQSAQQIQGLHDSFARQRFQRHGGAKRRSIRHTGQSRVRWNLVNTTHHLLLEYDGFHAKLARIQNTTFIGDRFEKLAES